MSLKTNIDWESAKKHMDAFWECDMIDRPCFSIGVWTGEREDMPEREQIPTPFDYEEDRIAAESFSHSFREGYRKVTYLAEGIPNMYPNWEGIPAMFGCKIKDFGNSFGLLPAVSSIYDVDLDILDINHPEVKRLLQKIEHYACNASGEAIIGQSPFGNPGDTLAKIVGYANILGDLAEDPDAVIKAETKMAEFWMQLYDKAYEITSKYQEGTCTWLPSWYKGRGALIEFDYGALISPEMYKLYLPCILERACHVEKNIYHLDGPDAVRHIDIILAQKEIHAVQWEPGIMCRNIFDWLPLMQKIQAAGKGLYVSGPGRNAEETLELLKNLKPEGLMLPVGVGSISEAEKFLEDVKKMM